MLNKYLQEFIDSIMRPSRSNRPFSDKIYQGTIIMLYLKDIYEKFRCTGNCFNVRNILKTKYAFCGTMMKTGSFRDAQQMKQN
jgi:hypothetical protein